MARKTRADIIRRIQAVGYLREIDTNHLLDTPTLTVEHNALNSAAFKLGGGTGIILDLRMKADRPIWIMEFGEFVLDGRELDVDWWVNEESYVYQFYGKRGPEFQRDVVLNHRVGDQGLVRPGIPSEGFLVGRSLGFLPMSLRQGFNLPATLSIIDGDGNRHLATLSVPFDNSLNIKFARGRSSLYVPSGDALDRSHSENNVSNGNRPALDAPGRRATRDQGGSRP